MLTKEQALLIPDVFEKENSKLLRIKMRCHLKQFGMYFTDGIHIFEIVDGKTVYKELFDQIKSLNENKDNFNIVRCVDVFPYIKEEDIKFAINKYYIVDGETEFVFVGDKDSYKIGMKQIKKDIKINPVIN